MIGDLFNLLFFGPIVNLLVVLYRAFESVGLPGALGFAIVVLSIIIRLIVWPFITSQLKSAKKMAELRPHLAHLKAKHKEDKQALAAAQMALYREHGVNPAGGCLPALIQFPVLIALYQAIYALFEGQHGLDRINHVLYRSDWQLSSTPDMHFFGINLASKPSEFATVGIGLLLVPLITGGLQFIQSKMMVPTEAPAPAKPTKKKAEPKEKETADEMLSAMQTQMVYLMPAMIAIFAFQFPVGLALYWNVFTILGIWHQYLISGWGALTPLIKRFV